MSSALAIAGELRARLSRGSWKPGQPFLSYREAVDEFGVSVGTVRRAFHVLVGEGYLLVEQGRVPRVKALPKAAELDVVAKLREASTALALALAELERREGAR